MDTHNELTVAEQNAGYKLLFDGKTLEGWDCTGLLGGWSVDDGCIVCQVNKGRFLYTREYFDHFILQIDFKIERGVNSGVFIRVSDLSSLIHNGIEMQIIDSHGKTILDKQSCGALYDLLEPSCDAAYPAGDWNKAIIECRNNFIKIVLNDRLIINMNLDLWDTIGFNPDGTSNKFSKAIKHLPHTGRIALQDHGGKVWFRNIKLLPLKQIK